MPASTADQTSSHSFDVPANYEKLVFAAKCLNNSVKKTLAKITNDPKSNIFDICVACDESIAAESAAQYKNLPKGVSFPTCVSKNKIACHYSPQTREDSEDIAPGDLVKIEVGAHIDNFQVVSSHSLIVPVAGDDKSYLKEHAEPMLALGHIKDVVLSHMLPDQTAEALIKHANLVAESLGCAILTDIMCFNLSRDPVVSRSKLFYLNPTQESKKDSFKVKFESLEVYNVDLILTKVKPEDVKKPVNLVPNEAIETTVFKIPEGFVDTKAKQANQMRSQLVSKYGNNTFNIRNILTDSKPNYGWSMLKKVIEDNPVSKASNNQNVYHLKLTVQIKDKRAKIVAGISPDTREFKALLPDYTLPAEVQKFSAQAKK